MITLELIKTRLAQLGYTASEVDDGTLTYISDTMQRSLKLTLNILEIGEEIENIVIDKICGEFLMLKKSTGQNINISVGAAVKAITEGDTSVQYDSALSGEAQLDMLIKWLISGRDSILMRCRRIRW